MDPFPAAPAGNGLTMATLGVGGGSKAKNVVVGAAAAVVVIFFAMTCRNTRDLGDVNSRTGQREQSATTAGTGSMANYRSSPCIQGIWEGAPHGNESFNKVSTETATTETAL